MRGLICNNCIQIVEEWGSNGSHAEDMWAEQRMNEHLANECPNPDIEIVQCEDCGEEICSYNVALEWENPNGVGMWVHQEMEQHYRHCLKDRIQNIQNEILKKIEKGDFKLEEVYFDDDIENPVVLIDIEGYKLRLSINLEMNFFYQMYTGTNETTIMLYKGNPLPVTLKAIGETIMLMSKKD